MNKKYHTSMIYVALFGPPGVGKSTLIQLAQNKGIPAYDIERLGTSYEERNAAFQQLIAHETAPYVLFGAADIHITDFPPQTTTILLLPPKDVYAARMAERDSLHPHKAGQNGLSCHDRFATRKDVFDIVFDEVASGEELLNKILKKTGYTGIATSALSVT